MLTRLLLTALFPTCALYAADWPAFKHDAARSSVTDEVLAFPLNPAWKWTSPQPPQPAWGEPGRSLNPLDFDYAFQAVSADGLVVFGSSADDTVRALDAASGALRWQVICGGPVRFAPQLENGRCYFASDDGCAYCVDAKSGAVIWKKRLALNGEMVLANGRLSSRWPCRSGVVVRGGTLYATAGMWPSEGVFIFALDAATGAEKWCNDTSCYDYIEYPHEPSTAFGGAAPQGALLVNDDVLLVPTGRGVPAAYDAKTGKLLHYRADSGVGHKGGTWATLVGDTVFVPAVGWQPDIPPRLGESVEHFPDSLAAFHTKTGKEEWSLGSAMKAAAPEWKATRWRGQIAAGILGRTRAVFGSGAVFAFGNGKADAWNLTDGTVTPRWSIEHSRIYAEALAGNAVLLGENERIIALDPASGTTIWSAPLEGQARGIAVANGRIFVSTSTGTLAVFGGPASSVPVAANRSPQSDSALPPNVEKALAKTPNIVGYAVVMGGKNAKLAQAIAEHSQLNVIALLDDEDAVVKERSRVVAETTLHGARLSIHAAANSAIPDYIASLVVLVGENSSANLQNAYRVLRPYGGILCHENGALTPPEGAPHSELQDGMLVRGKLEGAFDWDGKIPADERVKWPLRFSWWGGPGSQLQKSRHTRPRTPLAANGRLFIFGENTVSVVDAYTGADLWKRRLNSAIGLDAPVFANADSLFVASGNTVARFDAASGRLVETFGDHAFSPPVIDATKPIHLDGTHRVGAGCAVDIENTPEALRLILSAENKDAQRDDAWELAFDFRPREARANAPGKGTFEIVVGAFDGILRAHPTFPHPSPKPEKLPDGRIALTFPWNELDSFAGGHPQDFVLAADCKLWNAKLDLALWDKPLTNTRSKGLNDAEAIIALTAAALNQAPSIPVRPISQSPLKPARGEGGPLPLLSLRRPKADMSDFAAAGLNYAAEKEARQTVLPRAKGFEFPMREEPFTGTSSTRDYTPSYGCSGIISSALMDFMRSGSIGMYDRADDSGMRNISGIRSGCGQTLLPALGMLLYAEGTGNCLCTYNFATSFGMAPADTRRNEDWALFNEEQMDSASLQHIAFNLGAPGDRRDENGTLWLALPRPPLALKMNTTLAVPALIEATATPVRINTDRNTITGTSVPWLYGSNIPGLRKLHLDLQYYKPGSLGLCQKADSPTIDGELTDACWDGFGGIPVRKESTLWLRHDATHLYIAGKALEGNKTPINSITLGDETGMNLVALVVGNGTLEAKRLQVPPFDKKASISTLPELSPISVNLGDARCAGKITVEIAIPWSALESLGLNPEKLRASPNALSYFGRKAPDIVRNFTRTAFAIQRVTTPPSNDRYTIKLHFAELEPLQPEPRIFDILVNGKVVAQDFDIARETGGPMRALVREFKNVECGPSLDIELRPKTGQPPLLSALEVIRESRN